MALVPKSTKFREVLDDDMENFSKIDIFNFLCIKVKIGFILT